MLNVRHVSAKHQNATGLHLPRTGNHTEQRRLADAVRADQSDHAATGKRDGDIIERDRALVTLRHVSQQRNRRRGLVHRAAVSCSAAGHFASGLVKT